MEKKIYSKENILSCSNFCLHMKEFILGCNLLEMYNEIVHCREWGKTVAVILLSVDNKN